MLKFVVNNVKSSRFVERKTYFRENFVYVKHDDI